MSPPSHGRPRFNPRVLGFLGQNETALGEDGGAQFWLLIFFFFYLMRKVGNALTSFFKHPWKKLGDFFSEETGA